MSFILDALRKSESERQREASPSLSHAPLASGRRETPVWTWTVIGLLLLALISLSFAWWRSSQPFADRAATAPGVFEPADRAVEPARRDAEPAGPAAEPVAAAPAAGDAVTAGAGSSPAPPATEDPRPIAELHAVDPALPAFKLEFLAFSPGDASGSSAWINGKRYRPGQRVDNGPELVEVLADGVILRYRGDRFLLELR